MSWEEEIKKSKTPIGDKMKKEVKEILEELLSEEKEKITVSRSLLNMIWNLM